jgi:putative transposase
MAITQHHGRPGTPTDQAHVESFFSHLKGDWPHLLSITDPAALDTERFAKPAGRPIRS